MTFLQRLMIILYQVLNTPSTKPSSKSTIPVVCGKKKPRSYLSSVDEAKWESSTAVHFLARWWARLRARLLLRELCGICRCLHRIARADRGQERQKQREKQKKGPYLTEGEGEMDGNIGCSIFRNCTGDIGEDVSAGDELDGRNRYGGRGSVHTAEAVATAAWVRGHSGRVH